MVITKEQKHHTNLPLYTIIINIIKINNMLTARINPLTVCFILCLAIEATYEPEFCFSLFLIGGGGGEQITVL